ncbi:MAG TPA: glycosyltransferase family 4 protein [Terriglobales bacterium]|nr:glycosyltransferase family 4 protein [Terriglobales bacterium]
MHVLMTADTLGGVWTYTRELVTQLSRLGVRVTLVSFGQIPTTEQAEWLEGLAGVTYHPTAFRLEWMQDAQSDLEESSEFLLSVITEAKPDLLHFNQFYYGNLDCDLPRLVVAHSDVVSWWVSVHGAEPPDSEWIRDYRRNVSQGLGSADLVIAPTKWMLDQIETYYCRPQDSAVIYNGRDANLFVPHLYKDNTAISVGRLWDAGKQASLLLSDDLPIPTVLVGSEQSPEGAVASAQARGGLSKLYMKGPQSEVQLRQLLARAGIYVSTSRYEPFGLAPLEAALSRCAIVANDIPTFRELWGDDALFFERNNSRRMVLAIQELASNPKRRSEYAGRALERARRQFGSRRMAEEYLDTYRKLMVAEVVAA